MDSLSVLCEILLFLSCLNACLHVRKRYGSSLSIENVNCWLIAFANIGIGALLGALNYAGFHQTIYNGWNIPRLHSLVSRIGQFFGIMNLFLAAYMSIDQGPISIPRYTSSIFVGAFAGIQYLYLNARDETLTAIVQWAPFLSAAILSLVSVSALIKGVTGLKKSKCWYLIAALATLVMAQEMLTGNFTATLSNNSNLLYKLCSHCNRITLDSVDLFHICLSFAVFLFMNVAHPTLYL
jgi:hypothetical protein